MDIIQILLNKGGILLHIIIKTSINIKYIQLSFQIIQDNHDAIVIIVVMTLWSNNEFKGDFYTGLW